MILNEAQNIVDISNSQSIFNMQDLPSSGVNYIDYKKNWYKYQDNWYYFKELITEDEVTSELLGSYLAKYIDLPTVTYQIAKLNDTYGLISPDLGKDKNVFQNFFFWKKRYTNFYEFLINIYQDFDPILTLQFFKIALLNIYTNQKDFNTGSLLFAKEEDNLKLLGILDFEKAMITRKCELYFPIKEHNNRFFSRQLEDIPLILKKFPEFKEEINKFMALDIRWVLKKIEQDYGIKMTNYLKNNCLDNDKEIKKLLQIL